MAVFDGGAGNETYNGTDEADTIRGGGGDDVLSGLGGDDFINGDDGNDVIEGDDGTNDLRGGAGMDIISSSGFRDTIFAGDDDDQVVIRGTLGEAVSGGHGQDTLTFENAIFGPGSSSASFTGFESVSGSLIGTSGDDSLDLTSLSGQGGSPLLTISAGDGADTVISAAGFRQTIRGGAGNDEIESKGRDRVYGDAGADRISISGSDSDAFGGDGNDIMEALGEYGSLFGGDGADRLTGSDTSSDNLYGGNGSDTLYGLGGNDYLRGGTGRDFLFGNDGNDRLGVDVDAANDHDALIGGAGNDFIRAGYGDRVDGGEGDEDVLYLDLSTAPGPLALYIPPLNGASIENGGRAITGIEEIAELVATRFADDITIDGRVTRLYAGAGDDRVVNNERQAILFGADGNDTLTGLARDTLDGGEGDDQLIGGDDLNKLYGRAGADFADGGGGADIANGGEGDDKLVGSGGNDQLGAIFLSFRFLTDSGDDVIDGGAGDDALAGGDGNDTVIGGADSDALSGGNGDDFVESDGQDRAVHGGNGIDTVSFASAQAGISASIRFERGGDVIENFEHAIGSAFNDGLRGGRRANSLSGEDGNDFLDGREGDDRLAGGKGDDQLVGATGNDQLIGGDGTDIMTGGLGDDVYSVLSLSDEINENAGEGYDTVLAGINYLLADHLEQLNLLTGAGYGRGNSLNNRLIGNNGGVKLEGVGGADQLFGGGGSDRLSGGLDRDVSTGRGGADLFVFDDGETGPTQAQADVIADFSSAQSDRINLRAVDANETTPGEDQNFEFIGTAAFSGQARELRYETDDGDTYVYGDTDGDAVADLVIRLEGTHTLQAPDFVL